MRSVSAFSSIIGLFQKRSTLSSQRKFLLSGEAGENNLFLIIVSVLGHPNGVGVGVGGGITLNFQGMDVFWNDPMSNVY